MSDKKVQMSFNYKSSVDWIIKSYEDAGVVFSDGFQKDAIQNAVGARKSDKFKDWHFDISYIENDKGKFLVLEDSGTVGLIGDNLSSEEISAFNERDEKIPSNQRLARFSSMFNSGDNDVGPGLYGAGKSVYAVASKTYQYYYDSLREDGKYVANYNDKGGLLFRALENDEAKKYIYANTGLTEKKSAGTRIIILNPKDELIESINNGDLEKYIQASWWLTISKFGADSSISINNNIVYVPDGIKAATHKYELDVPYEVQEGYRVKHFGLYVFDKGDNAWNNISYYRKGMKIGEIELSSDVVPEKINNKYWGYIEVDEAWEEMLAKIEDAVHFGVSKGKKHNLQYKYLKAFANETVKEQLLSWGYIKDNKSENAKVLAELQDIAEEIQDVFDEIGFEDLGDGANKPDFDVRWQNVIFPEKDSDKVTSGDCIKFTFRVKSRYAINKKFEYNIYTININDNSLLYSIDSGTIAVSAGDVYTKDNTFVVSKNNSIQYATNQIVLSVKSVGSNKEKFKYLQYNYDFDKPDNKKEHVVLSLHECTFPRENSRRVNYDESINNVCYRIDNQCNHKLGYKLNVSIHNANEPGCPKIEDIYSFVGEIAPYEEYTTEYIQSIVFKKELYEKHLKKGVLELRARLIANEDGYFEKGDKITFYNYKIFLNCDEKNGKYNSFEIALEDSPEDPRRSWCTIETKKRFVHINCGHKAYLRYANLPDVQHNYLTELMAKEYVMLYIEEGKYDRFNTPTKKFENATSADGAKRVMEMVEFVCNKML